MSAARRAVLRAGLAAPLAVAGRARAQGAAPFPSRPIRLVVGAAPGGALDAHARLWAEPLSQRLGQPVRIDHVTGPNGVAAVQAVVAAAPDGHTLLMGNTGNMVINPAALRRAPYDTLAQLAAVARTAQQPLALLVNPDVPARSLREFAGLLSRDPGRYRYASGGSGTITHLVAEMLKARTGTFMTHLPYPSQAAAMVDLQAGQVHFMAETLPLASPVVRAGRVRALAVTGHDRSPVLPDVPTAIEAGLPGFEVVGFYGVLAPAGTPVALIDRLSLAIGEVLALPEIRQRMVGQGAEPAYLDADGFQRFLLAEMPRWAAAVKAAGAQVD